MSYNIVTYAFLPIITYVIEPMLNDTEVIARISDATARKREHFSFFIKKLPMKENMPVGMIKIKISVIRLFFDISLPQIRLGSTLYSVCRYSTSRRVMINPIMIGTVQKPIVPVKMRRLLIDSDVAFSSVFFLYWIK